MAPWLVLLAALAQSPDGGVPLVPPSVEALAVLPDAGPPPVVVPPSVEALAALPDAGALDAGVVAPQDKPGTLTLRGAAEGEVQVLPSGTPGGGLDGFLSLRPVFGLSAGEDFAVELGPTFRLRAVDTDPQQRAQDFGGVLRREDWDSTSDFGQLVQALRIAPDTSPFFARAGVVRKKTLGLGHLITRYSNQENPDYHPAGATAVLALGPVRGEFFASDVFAARVLAGAVWWDMGRTFSREPEQAGRYTLALELVHDGARGGLPAVPARCNAEPCTVLDPAALALSAMHLDGTVVVLRQPSLRLMVLAGLGSRFDARADLGFVLGGAADVSVGEIAFSVKAELRKQAGGFRQGLIGPSYELSRFAGLGFTQEPIAREVLPDSWSLHAELRVAVGSGVTVDGFAEYYVWGRTDLDGVLSLKLLGDWLVGTARVTGVGLGSTSRYAVSAGLKWRIFKSFYVTASGGTVFFPQVDGALVRGVTGSAGAGVDFER